MADAPFRASLNGTQLPGLNHQSPASTRVKFFSHLGQEILFVDFSRLDAAGFRRAAEECRRVVSTRPLGSVLTLVDITECSFDKATIQVVSDLAQANRPYVVRSAVIGVTGLRQLGFNAVISLTRREIRAFDSRDEALSWLVRPD